MAITPEEVKKNNIYYFNEYIVDEMELKIDSYLKRGSKCNYYEIKLGKLLSQCNFGEIQRRYEKVGWFVEQWGFVEETIIRLYFKKPER